MKNTMYTPTVRDIISACEYTGCKIIDQLGDEIPVTKENVEDIYKKAVEHIDASGNLVRIWTFDKIDEAKGLTEEDFNKFLPANPKWNNIMNACLIKIRKELDRLYWNKYQKEMDSPFDNTGASYSNSEFTVRAYNWDEDAEELPNFEWKQIKVYWYKHEGRGNQVYTVIGYDDPAIYAIMLNKCLKALKEDFGETDN